MLIGSRKGWSYHERPHGRSVMRFLFSLDSTVSKEICIAKRTSILYAATALTQIQNVQSLASRLPPWRSKLLQSHSAPAQLILLLSRGFAHMLGDDQLITKNILNKLFGHLISGQPDSKDRPVVEVLAAVIDQVPAPGLPRNTKQLLGASGQDKGQAFDTSDVNPGGILEACEGLAYHASLNPIFELPARVEQEMARPFTKPDISSTGAEKLPLLKIRFQDTESFTSLTGDQCTSLSLPVASTLFQSGHSSTVKYSRWKVDSHDACLTSEMRSDAKEHTVDLPFSIAALAGDTYKTRESLEDVPDTGSTHLSLPLFTLAQPCQIKKSMGNVITKLRSPDGLGEVPASQDLEIRVSEFLDRKELEASQVAVWALIVPSEVAAQDARFQEWAESMSSQLYTASAHNTLRVADLVWRGAKLRKVLSGGGGWGQKMGLLSIDPDDGYAGSDSEGATLDEFLGVRDHDKDPGIPQVAPPGDWIAFFAASDADGESDQDRTTQGSAPAHISSVDLGVLPGTIDMIPSDTDGRCTVSDDEEHVELFENRFGALSESGMCFERPHKHVKSKLDVPHARFSVNAMSFGPETERLARDAADEKGTQDPKPLD